MSESRPSGTVGFTAPTKPLLVVAVVVLGSVLGSGPVAFAFHRPWVMGPVAVVAFAVAVRSASQLPRESFHEPGVLEFVLAGVRVAAVCAAASLGWLALYYAIYWSVWAIDQGARRDPVAFWGSFWFGLLGLGALTWFALRGIPAQLYPREAATPRWYEIVLKYRRAELLARLGVGALVVTAIAAYAIGFHRNGLWLYVVIIVLLVLVAALASPARSAGASDEPALERTLEAALVRAGYRCRLGVRSRDGQPMPNVDLLAAKEGRTLALDVVGGSNGRPLEWVTGAGVAAATRRLEHEEVVRPGARPTLVLVDGLPAGSLGAFCDREGVTLAVVLLDTGKVDVTPEDHDLRAALASFRDSLRSGRPPVGSRAASAHSAPPPPPVPA